MIAEHDIMADAHYLYRSKFEELETLFDSGFDFRLQNATLSFGGSLAALLLNPLIYLLSHSAC